jgi:hypothetical protein
MATVDVDRLALAVAVGVDLVGPAGGGASAWRLGIDATFGVTRFGRMTITTSPPLEPTADRATWAPTVDPGVRVARRLARGTWLDLRLGVALVARAPTFATRSPEGVRDIASLWPVQPAVDVGLTIDPL